MTAYHRLWYVWSPPLNGFDESYPALLRAGWHPVRTIDAPGCAATLLVRSGAAVPTTAVLIPSNGATQSGGAAILDAGASANVTSVNFELTGGKLSHEVISGSTPTPSGWIGQWNTTTVPDGTYMLQSVASYAGGVTGTSAGITITVAN